LTLIDTVTQHLPDRITLHAAVTAISLLIYVATAHVQKRKRPPGIAIAWILFMLLAPYVALPAFLIFGARKRRRPENNQTTVASGLLTPLSEIDRQLEAPFWLLQTTDALGQVRPQAYEDFHLQPDGRTAWQALKAILEGAQHRIDLCTFILKNDEVGLEALRILSQKARAGVQVRLMVDGMGCVMGQPPDLKPLQAAGGKTLIFAPPLGSLKSWALRGRINLRDHRKMLIVDSGTPQARVWCGGRNLAVEYFEGDASTPAWHDLSFDFSGPAVAQAQSQFDRDWAFAESRGRTDPVLSPLADQVSKKSVQPSGAVAVAVEVEGEVEGNSLPLPMPLTGPTQQAQLIVSGPDQTDDTIHTLLTMAIYQARDHISILTPYFVPSVPLSDALCLAARRGVRVSLLVPAKSNHALSDVARARPLRALAAAGGQIFLAPTMHHAKLVIVDGQLALAGSANFDSRSLFLNYELMFAFHHPSEVQQFTAWFESERASATPFVPVAPGFAQDLVEGLLLSVGFQV